MNEEENKIIQSAIIFAKKERKDIANKLTDTTIFVPDTIPISVFMAGSPGAGKTEFSKNFLLLLEKEIETRVVRIDADEIRALIPGYTGHNSSLFNGAVSLIVERIHDLVLDKKQNFILDGTFSRHEKAIKNINRSLQKNRIVQIVYVYQKPEIAWKFTKAREETEGRNIPKSAFIEQFLGSREVIKHVLEEFREERKVIVILVKKNFETNTVEYIDIKTQNRTLDDHLPDTYTKESIEKLLL